MGPVNFSSIHELAEMGTDIIFIEKEGIVEVLSPFAKPCAIALVNTHGRTTKYIRKLVKIAKRSGARVCVLTDCDAVGIQVWEDVMKSTKIPRIGIDRIKTINYFRNHGFPDLTQEELLHYHIPLIDFDLFKNL